MQRLPDYVTVMRVTRQVGLLEEVIHRHLASSSSCSPRQFRSRDTCVSPNPIHLKVAPREVSWLECQVGVAQRLLTEVI